MKQVASLLSLMASLVTTSWMQQCFNVLIDIYHEFLLLFYCCVLLEIKLTTTTTTTTTTITTTITATSLTNTHNNPTYQLQAQFQSSKAMHHKNPKCNMWFW